MRLSVEMEKSWGGYEIEKYQVRVYRAMPPLGGLARQHVAVDNDIFEPKLQIVPKQE